MHIDIIFPQWLYGTVQDIKWPKVECIKTVRRMSGLGLTETKLLCETYGVTHRIRVMGEINATDISTLKTCGCIVGSAGVLLRDILSAHDRALELNEVDLAEELSAMITLLTLKYNVN